ncbi:hypothetical protein [Streptococcus ferus]|uniref:hypothetical protein n=1 Tax=Streptococcus ferus TaxID=1345 RepID=UPI0035A05DC7
MPIVKKTEKKGLFSKTKQAAPQASKSVAESRIRKVADKKFQYDEPKNLSKDLLSTIDLLDTAAILYDVKDHPIKIVNGYTSYLQFMEVKGKDLNSLSPNERKRTIANFEMWLSEFTDPVTFESTTLPTNTRKQSSESKRILDNVRREMNVPGISQRRYQQLRERETLLMQNIEAEDEVQRQLYNAEFILWLYADTIEDLARQVRKAETSGNNDFIPSLVSDDKKIQIIKQFNNQNEKV